MTAKTLMVLGTMSSSGKSLLATGLCRLYARRGWKVAPFKTQNLSNNAAVCSGGEIGRAQAVQAYAAGIQPTVDMNPVLLKPESGNRSQLVVRGKVLDSSSASDFYNRREELWKVVTSSLDNLRSEYELVIIEGAGSPAEINLRSTDMVNLSTAHYAKAPCLLVGDIDRGGVFAQLLGTLWLLEETDRSLIRGLVVNKFRGDLDMFTEGVEILEQRGGVPVLGVLPFIHDHGIAQEDATGLGEETANNSGQVDIAVIQLPHVSNFDDLDPLKFEPGIQLRYISRSDQLGQPAAVILPGTKNTLEDLQWLHQSGLVQAIRKLASNGTPIAGLCGGYQILGRKVIDSAGIESSRESLPGLGLLPVTTQFERIKTVTRSQARITSSKGFFAKLQGQAVTGYEIHMGQSISRSPICIIEQRESSPMSVADGACSQDGRVWGSYLHGIFDNDNFREAWLESLGVHQGGPTIPYTVRQTQAYDRLADVIETSLDIRQLDQIIDKGV